MIERLSHLPPASLEMVKHLSCLGNTIEIDKLHWLTNTPKNDARKVLAEPLRTGLLLQIDGNYAFAHDRVHEAAYAMLDEAERAQMHMQIGYRMMTTLGEAEVDAFIFEIADQLNRGKIGDTDIAAKEMSASVNLRAGRKARLSAAYAAACSYLAQGRAHIGESGWQTHYALAYSLALEHAECEFLSGDFEETLGIISKILPLACTKLDMAAIYRLKVELHVVKSENDSAIEAGLAALRTFGIGFSPHPAWVDVQEEFAAIWINLRGQTIESFADLPVMTNPETTAVMRILAELYPPAYFTDHNLMSLVICRMVNLSLVHGIADASNHGLALLGCYLMGPAFARYEEGHRIGKLACDLASRRNAPLALARVHCTMGLTSSWTEPLTTSIDWFRNAYKIGVEAGDLYFACYSASLGAVELLLRGHDLHEDAKECTEYLDFARSIAFRDGIDLIVTTERTMASLRGKTKSLSDFSDSDFDEGVFESELTGTRMNVVVFWYWTRKLMLHFLSGNYHEALASAERVQPGPHVKIIQIQHLDYHYYAALALASLIEEASETTRSDLSERLRFHYRQIDNWARETRSPTFSDKQILISAEIARIEGRELDAERLYEESIRIARENGFLQNEAIANELAARFYARRGFEKIASVYLQDARYCYLRWGADGKVRQLDSMYPQAWGSRQLSNSTNPANATVERLDLTTVTRVLEGISGEIVLDRLIDGLMRTAMEHAGAQRAVLLLGKGNELQVEAEATTDASGLSMRLRRDNPLLEVELPNSIIHFVKRTRECVILGDALAPSTFHEDTYLQKNHTRSALCLPLTDHTALSGLLYLENNLVPSSFTPTGVAVLKLIASQAAISLEITRLYRALAEREAKIRRLVDSDIIGIVMWDLDGRLLESNDAFLRMVQYTRDDLAAGLRWFDMTPPEWQEVHALQELEELQSTGMMQAREKQFFRKDGSRVPVLIGAATFEGQPTQGLAYILDLTERKRAELRAWESERRYREIQADLAHANRVATTGQLSASIAHEVNQPLTAMITNTQAALRWLGANPPNVEEVRDALASVVRNGNRASEVIGRVRALITKTPPKKEPVALNDAVREVIELASSEAGKNGIIIRSQLAEHLPIVEGDRVQLQQVVLNLIVNAIEAMGPSQVELKEILVATDKAEPNGIVVSVRDFGPGLAAEFAERIFEAFYTTKSGGMGMGLSICRSIVEAHGGHVWTKPNETRGALFGFNLPAAPQSANVERPNALRRP
jgi:PAS domain S-box-containing protein